MTAIFSNLRSLIMAGVSAAFANAAYGQYAPPQTVPAQQYAPLPNAQVWLAQNPQALPQQQTLAPPQALAQPVAQQPGVAQTFQPQAAWPPATLQPAAQFTAQVSTPQPSGYQPLDAAGMQALERRLAQVEAELAQARAQAPQGVIQAGGQAPVGGVAPLPDAAQPIYDENVVQAAANAAADKSKEDPKSLSAKWDNGLKLQSKDKNFSVRVGGRTQLDTVFYGNSPAGFQGTGGVGDEDSVDFRRARLRVEGTMYKYYDFAAEYEFLNTVNDNVGLQPAADSSGNIITAPAPTDLWMRARDVPLLGSIRIGNQKAPLGLEHLTSSRYLDFMERSFNQDAFYGPFNNGFQPGIAAQDTYAEQRGTWTLGVYKNTTNAFGFNTGDGEYETAGRITFLPYYEEEGRYLMHVGLGGSHRDANDDRIRLRARGSLRNGAPGPQNPVFADTGTIGASAQNIISPEMAIVAGPWLFQAEYTGSWINDAAPVVNGPSIGTIYVQGYYVEALYFLTGENRAYDREEARFTRVVPNANAAIVRQECGPICSSPGAWQLGVRYSKLDLDDSLIRGGTVQDVTVGLNWFLNPNSKLQWNYVHTHRTYAAAPGEGDIDGFGMRWAMDF